MNAYSTFSKATPSEREQWVRWLEIYGSGEFFDKFQSIAQDARSECVQCGQDIYLDIREGGGIPDWRDASGDYGCFESPDTNEDGTGDHVPAKGHA